MWASAASSSLRLVLLFRTRPCPCSFSLLSLISMDNPSQHSHGGAASPSASSYSRRSGRGKGSSEWGGAQTREERQRTRGAGAGKESRMDKIDALGRLLTRILRHMASELNLDMRSDGYVRVCDLLQLHMTTFANIRLKAHSVDDVKEAVRKDNKQRFSLLEENGELLIRANQGHTIKTIESESLLKPIQSAVEAPVCVHGTYKRHLESILQSGLKRMKRMHVHFSSGLPTDGEVISAMQCYTLIFVGLLDKNLKLIDGNLQGMRRDINVLIFLDVKKALEVGMKLYISDNRVILTEGFDGVVPVEYIEKIETWPDRQPIPFK